MGVVVAALVATKVDRQWYIRKCGLSHDVTLEYSCHARQQTAPVGKFNVPTFRFIGLGYGSSLLVRGSYVTELGD
jgi:hypothetical protein